MSPSRRYAWLVVALLVPVALLNYLDRQMLASMKFSVMRDIPDIALEAKWGTILALFKWVYAFLSPVGGHLDHGPCAHVRAIAHDSRADGHQRGVLHSRGARARRRLPQRRHAVTR